jgi:predicted ATP-grasp superfamily ATP-dependent carboligase
MFRPDPNGERSVDEVIAKLTGVLVDVPPDSPRAEKLTEMIRRLQQIASPGVGRRGPNDP